MIRRVLRRFRRRPLTLDELNAKRDREYLQYLHRMNRDPLP